MLVSWAAKIDKHERMTRRTHGVRWHRPNSNAYRHLGANGPRAQELRHPTLAAERDGLFAAHVRFISGTVSRRGNFRAL